MEYSTQTEDREFAALESYIESIFTVRDMLLEDGLTTGVAMEADQVLGIAASKFVTLRFEAKTNSQRLSLAMEGIVGSIWEHIKAFFQKLVEYIKKAWAWLTNQEKDLTESNLTEAADATKEFAQAAEEAEGAMKSVKRKKKEKVATEDASPKGITNAMVTLNVNAEEKSEQFENSLTAAEKLIIFSPSYLADMEHLSKRFARQNPIEQLTKKYSNMQEVTDTVIEEAHKVDAIEDYSERRVALEKFKETMAEDFKGLDKGTWVETAKYLAQDINEFHGARRERDNPYLAKTTLTTTRPDQLIQKIALGEIAFNVIREVVGQVKFTLDELKKIEELFSGLTKKIEGIAEGNGSKNHEAQSYAAQCLLTEAHAVMGQIKSITQGIAIFPMYFNDAHSAMGKLQKHVLSIFGDTVRALHESDDWDTDMIRTQYGKLQQAHARFLAVRQPK
jgi:hypothetical protein